jgi:hypothetical protein
LLLLPHDLQLFPHLDLTQTLSFFGLPAAALAFFFPQRFESSAGVADLTKWLSLMRIVNSVFTLRQFHRFVNLVSML